MSKTKKERKERKRYSIFSNKLLKQEKCTYSVCKSWPSRGIRSKHFKDVDNWESAWWDYCKLFVYPLSSIYEEN